MTVSKKKQIKPQPPATLQNFPVVGIGASAGGLDAFKQLLKAIPENSGMAFVLVQHLDPSHESILPAILQRETKIPVHEITEDIHLAPDHIYVIPSNKILTSTDGVLKLTDREKKINLSIDIFFTSLAEVHKECAIGVVLSGTGSDGTLGLKAIKEHGGMSIVQDPASAAYEGMPQSAVNAGVVDFILAPEKIPAQLLQINSSFESNHFFKDKDEILKDDEYIFKQILMLLHQRSGVDFTYYKQPTFHRRIARRIIITKTKNAADYLKLLRTNKDEQDALFLDVLIPVTSFFRDPKTFHALTEMVFPAIIKNKSSDENIRIWIAGCSTGEEAFSIAICLHEYLTLNFSKREGTKIQIFASDISEKAIKKARTFIYAKADVEKLSEIQINNYFVKNNGGYEVKKLIRDMCVFAPHNFLKDPPFAKMDLISCRNVLIYMDSFLQKKAFSTFHYALKENGFLLLGKSETVSESSDLFTQVEKHEKIYLRKSVPGRFMHVAIDRREEALKIKEKNITKQEAIHTDFRKSAENVMILKSPASVVVNKAMDIVHIHGDITPFLQVPQGKPTQNLIKMAGEGLAFELRNAIHKVTKEQTTVTKEDIPVKNNGKQSLVTIEIIPLTDTIELYYLIRFEKKIIHTVQEEKKSSSGKIIETQKQNEQLEKELFQTREDMRSITENMEASNEELQSANEELQSSNEEMQSLNEELETSKEELQSTNEELIIVNQELLEKQEQLNAARNFSDSIFTTISEPLIVLDKKLRIKTANASFYKKFNIEEHDIEGKLFYQIQDYQWDDNELRMLLENIISQKKRLTNFEYIVQFPSIGECTFCLNALQIVNENNSEQLILLAIEDITDKVVARKIIEESTNRSEKERKLLHDFFKQAPAVLAILKGPEYLFEFANPAYMDFVGNHDIVGKTLLEAIPEIAGQGFIELLNNVYNTGEPFTGNEVPVKLNKSSGKLEQFYVNLAYHAFKNDKGETEGILIFAYDVTEQVEARKQIEASEAFSRSIIDSSPDCIKLLDSEGYIQYMNSSAICLMEIDDFLTVKNKFWWTLWGSENEALAKASLSKALKGETSHFTALRPTVKGTQKWWDIIVSPLGISGETTTRMIVTSRDITEKKKSDEAVEKLVTYLKLATDSAKVGIWSLDVISSKLEWSNIHKIMWGYDEHREDLTFEDWHKLIVPEDKESAFLKIEESKANHGIYELDYRIIRANDGAIVWIKSTGQYQYDVFDVAHTLCGISIDITYQKMYDSELVEAKSKAEIDKQIAENAVISKQQFLSNMSHEIRTPMNAIIGFTKVLMKTDLTEKQKEYLQAIKSSGSTLIVLINDILDLAKVDAGKMIFANLPFKIAPSITSILHLFETKIEESNLELINESDSRIPEIVLGDSVRLNQILINLLSNAIKFTLKGKIIVNVTLLSEDNEKVTLEIKVIDTGIGIPQNKIATIFENFEQASSTTSSLYGGTGLGLAIAKQLVEKQGGTISVKSKVDEGSTFSFTLSFQKSIAEVPSEIEEVEYKTEFKPLKVLIVEDVKLNQLLLRTILDDFKFGWDIADNGQVAIEKLHNNSYDIILMDLQMPIMNGFDATEYIRNKMNLQIPIIALTADVTTVDLEKCKAVGMNDYITKPLDDKLLYNKIIDLLQPK